MAVYNVLRFLFRLLFLTVFRWKVEGKENIPTHGGAIIAPNHISLWDPPLMGAALSRRIHFMAKEELFSYPVFRWIITQLKAFPVKRGAADRNAIRTAVTLLEQGELVGLFPEGTRGKNGVLGPAEPGVLMIAVKANVPIIPVAIIGTDKVGRFPILFPRFIVRFGKPLTVSPGKLSREETEVQGRWVMAEIAALLGRQ